MQTPQTPQTQQTLKTVPTQLAARAESALEASFVATALGNPINRDILARLPQLALPHGYLVAGCLFQAVWNAHDGQPAATHVKDYDLFYFDDGDLSWQAEDAVIQRAKILFADLDAEIEVRNQARVHLWYQQKFGVPCPRLTSVHHGIDRFLVACTCVGIRPTDAGGYAVYASYGLDDMHAGLLRANPVHGEDHLFQKKAANYQARWPWLTIV